MTKDQNQAQQQAQDHPPSWSEVFGEDLGPSQFLDLDAEPSPTSSAAVHARRRQQADQEQRRGQDLAQLQVAAQEEKEDQALERAIHLINKGGYPGKATAELAMRSQRRRGTSVLSSAEILAARIRRR
jgi:hypothetical protein